MVESEPTERGSQLSLRRIINFRVGFISALDLLDSNRVCSTRTFRPFESKAYETKMNVWVLHLHLLKTYKAERKVVS